MDKNRNHEPKPGARNSVMESRAKKQKEEHHSQKAMVAEIGAQPKWEDFYNPSLLGELQPERASLIRCSRLQF